MHVLVPLLYISGGMQNKNSWGYCCYQMVDCCARPIYESQTIKRIILLSCNCPCYKTRPYLFDFAFASSFFSSSLLFEPRLLLSMLHRDTQPLLAAAPGFRFLGGWALREKNLRGLSPQSLIFQAPDFKKFRVFDWIWGGLDRIWGGSAPSRPSLAPPLAIALTALCASGVGTLLCIFLFDLFQYCVWWHYMPATDNRWCPSRSKKHQRYVPYILHGDFREANQVGDRPCSKNPCTNSSLEHIVMFHTAEYKPQPRWGVLCKAVHANDRPGKPKADPLYIGFHATTTEAAKEIAHSNFRESSGGVLGAGVYFARSLRSTDGKANHEGAWFVAQIRTGNVRELNELLPQDQKSSKSRYSIVHVQWAISTVSLN